MANKTLRLSKPPKNKIEVYFLASDWHDEFLNMACLNILEQMAGDLPRSKRKLIIPGDFLDLPDFMTKKLNQYKRETVIGNIDDYYIPRAEAAFDWGNNILDRLQKTFSEIILMEGNHDWRLYNFNLKYAPRVYHRYFDFKENLSLDSRKIRHVKYNYWLDIGHLSITHGMYHGTSALNKHHMAAGTNVIFGHVHKEESKSFVRRGDTIKAWSLPCMCDMNPEYLKDSENNWSNGFGVVSMKSNGNFNYWPCLIFNEELVSPYGKIYKA